MGSRRLAFHEISAVVETCHFPLHGKPMKERSEIIAGISFNDIRTTVNFFLAIVS